jgi:hypothetical protein
MSDIVTPGLVRPDPRPKRQYTKRQPPITTPTVTESDVAAAIAKELAGQQFTLSRPEMRPPMREEDSHAAAARRAAEIRGHLGGDMDEGTDVFQAPPPPPGWSYEWKTETVLGQEDPAYQVQLARMGWEPVPAQRHPEMMPTNSKDVNIRRKGQVLMMRPQVITDEARSIERRRARDQVRVKEQQLGQAPEGQFGRNHPSVQPNIKRGYSPVDIPPSE